MQTTVVLVAIATFVATVLGGLFAIRFRDKLHIILGFSAGAVVAVAFFDLLPEALEMGAAHHELTTVTSVVALGFLGYLLLDRLIFFRFHSHAHDANTDIHERGRGTLGAAALSLHSFLDGVGIGLAFQVSPAVGAVVAAAVLTHDFSDGINTVNFIFKHAGERPRALKWLFVDALAPVLGAASTLLFSLSESSLGLMLALFTGFFLYIGASDLIPESHHAHPKLLTTLMTLLGAFVLYVAIRLAGL